MRFVEGCILYTIDVFCEEVRFCACSHSGDKKEGTLNVLSPRQTNLLISADRLESTCKGTQAAKLEMSRFFSNFAA